MEKKFTLNHSEGIGYCDKGDCIVLCSMSVFVALGRIPSSIELIISDEKIDGGLKATCRNNILDVGWLVRCKDINYNGVVFCPIDDVLDEMFGKPHLLKKKTATFYWKVTEQPCESLE